MKKIKIIVEFKTDQFADPDELLDWTQFTLENADYTDFPEGVLDDVSVTEYTIEEEEEELGEEEDEEEDEEFE